MAPNKPFLVLDRVLVRALLVVMLGVTVVQCNLTFERRMFSDNAQQYMADHLGLFKHRVFGQWQFTAMTQALAIVYYDAQGNEQWLPWNRSDGHVGSGAYSRFWTWWWLVSLPGNGGRNDACARIAEEWAMRNQVSLETGRVVIKVRPLIGGHFWEKDRQKSMEGIPWADAATITWFDGQRRFDWPSPEQRRMLDDPLSELYLPLDTWREVGDKALGERYLLAGWSWPESWGRWSAGRRMQLAIPQAGELGLATTVRLDVVSYTTKKAPVQPYRILMADTLLNEGGLGPGDSVISFVVPASLNTKRTMVIDISVPKAQVAKDGRRLAVGLKRISIGRGEGPVAR